MATYRLSFLFQQGVQGWSENWYYSSTDTPQDLATRLGVSSWLGPYTALKGDSVSILAMRVSDVADARSNFLYQLDSNVRALNGGQYGPGDMAGASLLADLYTGQAARRPFLYRGLAESLTNYDPDGFAQFSAQFRTAWAAWIGWLTNASGLQIRSLVPPGNPPANPNVPVLILGTDSNNPSRTLISTLPPQGFTWPSAGRLVFHKLNRRIFPAFSGTIPYVTISSTVLAVPIPWASPAPSLYPGNATCRVATFSYGNVSRGIYRDFRTRKVGRPFGPARGRRPGVRYRAS